MVIIPPDVALTCLQIVQRVRDAATVAVAATALLAGGFWLASTRETGGAIDETQTLDDGTVVRLTGHGSDRIRTITATSPDGVVSVLEVEATGYGYTLIGGAVDGKPMTPGQLRSAARQASGGEVQVVYNGTPGKGHNGGPEYNEDDAPGGNGGNNGNGNGPNLPPVVPGKSGDSGTSGGTDAPNGFGFDTSNVESKLKGYLLDPAHPQNQSKAMWFNQALGFNQSNWQRLASQLRFDPSTAVATKTTQYGQTYEQVIAINGANGKTINTTFVFMKDNSGAVRLVTGIPAKK
ncbi:DUF6883 domain-containing protein [Pannonibacter phragmitetus]|uniref:DUF6883 domain-containing protein n=1 Tax=Pannonibacter phragmitetus TaxID=121719 RepID=UPI003D2F23B9